MPSNKETLFTDKVSLGFRARAEYEEFLSALWKEAWPHVAAQSVERAADLIRAEAVARAAKLGAPGIACRMPWEKSQAFCLLAALDLYHYIHAKLLVLTSAVRWTLEGPEGEEGAEPLATSQPSQGKDDFLGEPSAALLLDRKHLKDPLEEIKQTLSLSAVNNDYRILAMCPEYLAEAWDGLKPIVRSKEYVAASSFILKLARRLSRHAFSMGLLANLKDALSGSMKEVLETTAWFERLLPPLILNVALLELDWRTPNALTQFMFPVQPELWASPAGSA